MSTFWHVFVIVLTVGSIIGCLWLLFGNARGKPGESTTGHVWDEDLREYNNPLPRWWLNLFILTVVFAVGYLVIYPGLGNYLGTARWTQQSEMQKRLEAVKARRQMLYASLGDRDIATLAHDPSVRALGQEVFLGSCAGCHGADAQGALGFPNLTDADWLYGGTPAAIHSSITQGRHGQMPAFNGMLDARMLDDLVDTLIHWSDPKFDAARRQRAMQQFSISCAACHGADARGNVLVGAPNLTDAIWLHGGRREDIRQGILFGRRGNMPPHAELLSADDIRVVAAYVYGLSNPAP